MKGLLIGGSALLVFAIYCKMQRRNDSPKIFYRKKLIGGYTARIVPPFGIVIKESEKGNDALLEHEMIHWKQYQREGLIPLLINYSKETKKVGYDKNKYEIEARIGESDYCKKNYTECVRNGLAKTVYNPQFRIV
jgi:hypothetical protein